MARERSRARGNGGGEPDRLSDLPDCLLHTIMSLLKARQAVQTCVLSRRWRHLWLSAPCLDIDLDEFMAETAAPNPDDGNAGLAGDGSDSDDDRSVFDYESSDSSSISSSSSDDDDDDDDDVKNKEWECFQIFTMNLMFLCNFAQLESFRLHIGRGRAPSSSDIEASAGPLSCAMRYFTHDCPTHRHRLSSSCPWLLKRLHLCHVRLDDRFMKHVNSVCHSLEDMKLEDCRCVIQSITSDSLKTLILKRCRWLNLSEISSPTLKTLAIDGGSNHASMLVILAPAVAYLHLAVNVASFWCGISLNTMPSLAKASIQLRNHRCDMVETKLSGDQFELLCSISNVTSLELSDVGTTVIFQRPTFQEFKKLRNLVLANCDLRDDFRTLRFFLQNSPKLERLTLQLPVPKLL